MPIKIGLSESDLEGNSILYSIPANSKLEAQIAVDMDHIVSGELCRYKKNNDEFVWEYTGKEDPCYQLNINPSFNVIIPCYVKLNKHIKQLVYIRGPKQFATELLKLEKKFGDIRGMVVQFERKDGKYAKYTISPTGIISKLQEVDIDNILKPLVSKIFQGTSSQVYDWLGSKINIKANPTMGLDEEEL